VFWPVNKTHQVFQDVEKNQFLQIKELAPDFTRLERRLHARLVVAARQESIFISVLFGTAFREALGATSNHPFPNYSTPDTASGEFMFENHRTTPRFNLRIPIRIRRIDQPGSPEFTVLTSNVSAGGAYFASERHFQPGTPVRMYFTVPETVFGLPAARWRCEGRVVYTLFTDLQGYELAAGVSFQTHTLLNVAAGIRRTAV